MDETTREDLSKNAWKIEEYHRGIKQFCGVETYIRQVDIKYLVLLVLLFLTHFANLYSVQNWLTYEPNLTIYINNELFLQ
jgi:hypothetical protein